MTPEEYRAILGTIADNAFWDNDEDTWTESWQKVGNAVAAQVLRDVRDHYKKFKHGEWWDAKDAADEITLIADERGIDLSQPA